MTDYVKGDATYPTGSPVEPKIIAHICNDRGQWGKGFVLAVSKRWAAPEKTYRAAFTSTVKPELGDVQFVSVQPGIEVANIIGQHGIARRGQAVPPIRYDAVRRGLQAVARHADASGASVHMPRIGCGLAGGNWEVIEQIIAETLISAKVRTVVYDFE